MERECLFAANHALVFWLIYFSTKYMYLCVGQTQTLLCFHIKLHISVVYKGMVWMYKEMYLYQSSLHNNFHRLLYQQKYSQFCFIQSTESCFEFKVPLHFLVEGLNL